MADIIATQREALSGMNLSDHEKRMKELEAELEAVKARIAETKANIANLKADKKLIESAQATTQDRGLEGEREEDGSLKTETKIPTIEELNTWYHIMVKQAGEDWMENPMFKEQVEWYNEQKKLTGQATNSGFSIDGEEIPIAEWDENQEFDADGNPIPITDEKVVMQVETDDVDTDDDIEGDERKDERSKGMVNIGIDREQGRTKGAFDDIERSEKPGWETKEGSNTWSINEKDDYWKTQDGYDEAVALYGSKPAWVKEPTLVWNPAEQKYEEIEEEEFEDLSRPAISADIKKLFG
jgi:hypothetical protein